MVIRVPATRRDLAEVAAILIVGEIVRFPSIHLNRKRSQLYNRLTKSSIVKA